VRGIIRASDFLNMSRFLDKVYSVENTSHHQSGEHVAMEERNRRLGGHLPTSQCKQQPDGIPPTRQLLRCTFLTT
jgi:hypothetical protein